MKPPLTGKKFDDFQTPPYALKPLLPYLKKGWVIWECAEGRGNLTKALRAEGYAVVGSDILDGHDFLRWHPDKFDCIVTNPPFSLKDRFLSHAYSLGRPFAFLLPLTTLETKHRQTLFRVHGLEMVLLPWRVDYEVPSGSESKNWFASAWFTNGLDIGRQLVFFSPGVSR